jgi:hypothetical protein
MKKYVIINNPIVSIDFNQVDQNSKQECLHDFLNVRYVISYDGEMPDTVKEVENKSQEYTKEEIIPFLSSPNWSIYDKLMDNDIQEFYDHIKFYEEVL